jgi:hypothetical protein
MKIPPAEVVMLEDGTYRISVGTHHQYVTSMHLVDQHIVQLERIYREKYDQAVQPYLE